MITVWIIGLVLCLIILVLMKYTVEIETEYHYHKDTVKEEPMLRVWMILVGILIGIIPIVSLILELIFLVCLIIGYCTGELRCKLADTKLGEFLNKPIT